MRLPTMEEINKAIKNRHADERAMEKFLNRFTNHDDRFMKQLEWKYGTKYFKYLLEGEIVYSTQKRKDLKELKFE